MRDTHAHITMTFDYEDAHWTLQTNHSIDRGTERAMSDLTAPGVGRA